MRLFTAALSLLWLACASAIDPRCHPDDLAAGIAKLDISASWRRLTPDLFEQQWPGHLTRRESGELVTLQTPGARPDECSCCVSAMFTRGANANVHLQQLRIEFGAPDSASARAFAISVVRHFYPDNSPSAELELDEPPDSRIDRAFVVGSMPPQSTGSGLRTVNLVLEKDSSTWHATIVANDASGWQP